MVINLILATFLSFILLSGLKYLKVDDMSDSYFDERTDFLRHYSFDVMVNTLSFKTELGTKYCGL